MTAIVAPSRRVRNVGQRRETLAVSHFRLMVMMLCFGGATLAIGGKLGWMAITRDGAGSGRAVNPLIPSRGEITDRNGRVLASSIDAWTIGVHPNKLLGDPEDIAPRLAQLMPERTEAQYLRILRSSKKFVYLRRRALPELVSAVNAIGEPGMAFAREPERLYPQTSLAAHVLGWTNIDGHGVTGMERVLDRQLTDPVGRTKPVALSIDSRVQAALESEILTAMAKHSAIGGAGVVLDVDTGEVIALTSLPSFNPNAAGKFAPELQYNKATMGVYELGSTFKPITAAAALETGVVPSMTKKWDATAPLQVGRFRIKDDHPQKRWLNLPEMMVHSSNIVTAQIADELGAERMQGMFRKLGFDQPVDIELAEKGGTLWPKFWARTTVMTSGYGHGIAVTPLHLANAYATLTNGGVWRPMTLLKRDPDHIPQGRRVISEATSYRIRQLMRLVVTDGTGERGNAPGYRLGAKTGTAEKPHLGGYAHSSLVTTFASVFPMDKPRYVVIAMLDEAKGTADTYGFRGAAWVAAPIVAKVIPRIGPILGVQPDDTRDIETASLRALLWKPRSENKGVVAGPE